MLDKILGPDPKTTVAGILTGVGLAASKASTFGLPHWVDFVGTCVAALGVGILGRTAMDRKPA